MSIALMTEVWKVAPYKQSELLILLALADSANDEGVCWPSVGTLARRGRVKERQVQKALTRLEADGWLQRRERAGRSTIYTVTIPSSNPSHRTLSEPEPVPQDAFEGAKRPTGRGAPQDGGALEDGGGVSSRTGGGVPQDTQNHKEPSDEPSPSSPPHYPGGGMPKPAPLEWYPPKEVVEQVKSTYPWATDVTLRAITMALIAFCKKNKREPDDSLWLTFCRNENRDREAAERKEREASSEKPQSWFSVAD